MTLPSVFVPLAPIRTIDTRDGTGGVARRPLNPEERLSVPVTGVGGVPDSGVTAVVANITSVEATQPMFFTAYPGSTKRPETSNINGGPGRPVPNLVIMGVGIDGCIEVYNSHGSTHCLVDVFGYFREGAGDRFNPVTPARLFDTRVGHGVPVGKIPAGTPVEIQVAGWAGVPLDGATAVVMNLTATEPESPGFLRLTPSGTAPVVTSNVNFFAWDTVPNLAICKLGEGGRITLDTAGQATHALGDVFGYFSDDGGRLRAMPPQRLLDTRYGVGTEQQPIGPDRTIRLEVAGHGQIPSNATAIVLNVAAMNEGTPSFVSVWPSGLPRPDTSNLNVWPGQTIANLVICQVGADGAVEIGNPVTTCDVLADALGFFVACARSRRVSVNVRSSLVASLNLALLRADVGGEDSPTPMPLAKLTRAQIEHLLRRTEFVARPQRVDDLMAMATRELQVDDVLAVGLNGAPVSVSFTPSKQNWQRGEELTHFWFDRMSHDAARPIQEKLAFFWHGHFCSEFGKVGSAELMREQIDLFRHEGMTDLRNIATKMSTQVAMLRYLDNNQNKQASPNQNFARELMELFLLGVGNYTEADVEAGTAAWTGHTDQWDTDAYVWRNDWHDASIKQFLG
jgi:hypothetical protein